MEWPSAITITYCDRAENHPGMQVTGKQLESGLSVEDMRLIQSRLADFKTELVMLDANACVLAIRQAVNQILGNDDGADIMYKEHVGLPWDKEILRQGRVVPKLPRHNLCYGPEPQSPDYKAGKGRIIPWQAVPCADKIRAFFAMLHPKFADLVAEGNHYYDPTKCGIRYHGDTERRVVIAVRLGQPIPLVFRQFDKWRRPLGDPIPIMLNAGDIYIMSDKAIGYDWRSTWFPVWLHAAGAPMYLKT